MVKVDIYALSLIPGEIRQEIEIEGIQIGRKEVKVSIFTDHVISYAEHSKKSKHTPTHKTIGK